MGGPSPACALPVPYLAPPSWHAFNHLLHVCQLCCNRTPDPHMLLPYPTMPFWRTLFPPPPAPNRSWQLSSSNPNPMQLVLPLQLLLWLTACTRFPTYCCRAALRVHDQVVGQRHRAPPRVCAGAGKQLQQQAGAGGAGGIAVAAQTAAEGAAGWMRLRLLFPCGCLSGHRSLQLPPSRPSPSIPKQAGEFLRSHSIGVGDAVGICTDENGEQARWMQ